MKKEQKPITKTELNAILTSDYPADFSNRLLVGVNLSHNRGLEMSDFRGAVLRGCTISHCKLDNSHFEGADLGDTRFIRCKMEYAHFGGARMESASFDRCALVGSTGLYGDTRMQSEVIFDENIGFVRGVNMELAPDWRRFAWEMCEPDQDNYKTMLDLLSESFCEIDKAYPGMGAEIFNSGYHFLPQELSGAANFIAKGGTAEAAHRLAVDCAFSGVEPLPGREMFVLPHSDVQQNIIAERVFTAQIQRIQGADFGKLHDWMGFAKELGGGESDSYRQSLQAFSEGFELIEQRYPGVAAPMFNHGPGYLPSEMLAAAEWIDNGASPEEALDACVAQHELAGVHFRHELWREGHQDGERADFTGRELKNLDFSGMSFHEAVFTGAHLENCWMNEASFTCCDFSGAAFLHVSAIGADFEGAVFDGASLVRSDFQDAYFEGASFVGVDIHDCEGLEGVVSGMTMTL
jgi:uncharacterized protein YjbI with pentapeptide repeats